MVAGRPLAGDPPAQTVEKKMLHAKTELLMESRLRIKESWKMSLARR